MNLLYIATSAEQTLNLTKTASTTAAAAASTAATVAASLGAAAAFASRFSGPGLLIGLAQASPAIYQLMANGNKPTEIPKEFADLETRRFIAEHGRTIEEAKQLGYKFPPGHPQVGRLYRLHPLSDHDKSKADVYIPDESHDETLLSEREAELIKLLVEMGATKIAITEKKSDELKQSVDLKMRAQNVAIGEVDVGASSKSSFNQSASETRVFELVGKPWKSGDQLDQKKFAWIAFEPSWTALIVAREIGQCTKAAVEVREETSFSTDKALNAAVKGKMFGGGVSGQHQSQNLSSKVYEYKVEFGIFVLD